MKQLFLSFAAILLIATGANAQRDVTINNATGCDIEVTVTSYILGCMPSGTLSPAGPTIITNGNFVVFTDPNATQMEVNAIIDPGGANITFTSNIRVFNGIPCLSLTLPFSATGSGTATCTANTSFTLDATTNTVPSGVVDVL